MGVTISSKVIIIKVLYWQLKVNVSVHSSGYHHVLVRTLNGKHSY